VKKKFISAICAYVAISTLSLAAGNTKLGMIGVDVVSAATATAPSAPKTPAPKAPGSGSSTIGQTSSTVKRILVLGSTGSDVKLVQAKLNENGAKLKVDGIFGNLTLAAVKTYQGANGLKVDGIVGPMTVAKLVPAPTVVTSTLSLGSTGHDVKLLQTKLNENGAKLKVDGVFGNLTLAAVRNYQRANGLVVDGIVGPRTIAKLYPATTTPTTPTTPTNPTNPTNPGDNTTPTNPGDTGNDDSSSARYVDGTYKAANETFATNGWRPFLNLVVRSGKIDSVVFDYEKADGSLKSADAGYAERMFAKSGVTPVEAAEKLTASLKASQDITMVDTVTGATSTSNNFKNLATALLKNAEAGNKADVRIGTGTYKAAGVPDERQWKPEIEITYTNGRITEIAYKEAKADGSSKTTDPGYATRYRTEEGLTFGEMVDRLIQQLLSTQAVDKVDTVSGATSTTNHFRNLANQAIGQRK
jgi:major membrane immunogen (membrane-anchored lipoprotein)/predicted small secreted protein